MKLRRHRRALGFLVLGAWVFALFAAFANACIMGPVSASQGSGFAVEPGHEDNQDPSANCLQFCNDETPVVLGKPQLVSDQPAAQPLLVATLSILQPSKSASVVSVVHLAHPPPDVPLLRRSLRLAL